MQVLGARNKACATSEKEERHTLMPVSPIKGKTEIGGLSRNSETGEAQEGEMEEGSMSDRSPVSMEAAEEE